MINYAHSNKLLNLTDVSVTELSDSPSWLLWNLTDSAHSKKSTKIKNIYHYFEQFWAVKQNYSQKVVSDVDTCAIRIRQTSYFKFYGIIQRNSIFFSMFSCKNMATLFDIVTEIKGKRTFFSQILVFISLFALTDSVTKPLPVEKYLKNGQTNVWDICSSSPWKCRLKVATYKVQIGKILLQIHWLCKWQFRILDTDSQFSK